MKLILEVSDGSLVGCYADAADAASIEAVLIDHDYDEGPGYRVTRLNVDPLSVFTDQNNTASDVITAALRALSRRTEEPTT